MLKPVDPRPDFPEMEKKHLKRWYESGVVKKYLHKNDASKTRFSFQDGPITANNPMGVHHAWGRSYKDLWQKFHNLLGDRQRFQNGFDCQGLWVEVEVEKEIEIRNKRDIENLVPGDPVASVAKFVQLCRDRVMKYSTIQTDQTKRLGNFMDWDNSYFTMSDENNYMIWHFLKVCFDNGWMYKGHDTVPWCPRCQTAISQHEMLTEDYKEATHESIFVKLPITTAGWENTSLLIWTTTPWTVPANVAVGINTSYTYALWKAEDGTQIVFLHKDSDGNVPTRQLKKKQVSIDEYVFANQEISYTKVKEISGKELLGLTYAGPFDNFACVQEVAQLTGFHTVIDASDLVNAAEGTGLLHVAPAAGTDDFRLGKKLGLPVISVIDDEATYLETVGDLAGQNAKKHPELIIDRLREKWLLKSEHYTHRYPACWRCKTELVWKIADEWYISMDTPSKTDGQTFREKMQASAKKIQWIPDFGLERELDWLKNMSDWLISKKNRYWGLALPIYECQECGTFDVLDSKEELKERAVEGWSEFEGKSPHKPYIDLVKIACPSCGKTTSRIDDVGNPWLDAGIVPFSTISDNNDGIPLYTKNKEEWKKWFPVDFITESFPGQFKNWFYALIAMSSALENEAPFKSVLGFATLHAEDGRPMHKSWGNSIEFNEAADKIGADVMRWMYARTNPTENMLFGYKIGDEVRRSFILMLWNTYKFFVEYALLDGYKPAEKSYESSHILDRWIKARLYETVTGVEEDLKAYDARSATVRIENLVQDISTSYIRRSRNRVWTQSDNAEDKESFYSTLHAVLRDLSIIMSPIIPFLSDEMYTNLTGEESVHLSKWPTAVGEDAELISQMNEIHAVIESGHRERKNLGIKVRQGLASFATTASADLANFSDILKDELNVKSITFGGKKDEYDSTITPELQREGDARELLRTIQQERQKMGLKQSDHIHLTVQSVPEGFEEYICQRVLADSLTIGDSLIIQKVS